MLLVDKVVRDYQRVEIVMGGVHNRKFFYTTIADLNASDDFYGCFTHTNIRSTDLRAFNGSRFNRRHLESKDDRSSTKIRCIYNYGLQWVNLLLISL